MIPDWVWGTKPFTAFVWWLWDVTCETTPVPSRAALGHPCLCGAVPFPAPRVSQGSAGLCQHSREWDWGHFLLINCIFWRGIRLGMQLQNISEKHLPLNIALSREKLPLSPRWLRAGGAWAWEIGIHKSGTIPLLSPSASSFSYNKGINSFAGLSISGGQRQTSEQWAHDAAGFTNCIKNIIRLKSSLHWRNLFYLNTEFYLAFIVLNGFI